LFSFSSVRLSHIRQPDKTMASTSQTPEVYLLNRDRPGRGYEVSSLMVDILDWAALKILLLAALIAGMVSAA
jgi:hypothetical protein